MCVYSTRTVEPTIPIRLALNTFQPPRLVCSCVRASPWVANNQARLRHRTVSEANLLEYAQQQQPSVRQWGPSPILTPSFPLPLLHLTQAMTSSRRLLDKSMAKLEKVGLAIVCRGRVCIQPLEVVLPHCSIYLHTHTRHGNGVAVVQFQSMAQVGGGYAVDPPEVRVQHATTVYHPFSPLSVPLVSLWTSHAARGCNLCEPRGPATRS